MYFATHNRGVSVIEILIGLAIFVTAMLFIFQTLTAYFSSQQYVLESTQALYLAESGSEMLKYIRDEDWNTITNLSPETIYYFAVSTSTIVATTTPELIDNTYTRSFILRSAYRDGDDDFVASTTPGASVDAGSYTATVRVEWGNNKVVRLYSLVTNLHDV